MNGSTFYFTDGQDREQSFSSFNKFIDAISDCGEKIFISIPAKFAEKTLTTIEELKKKFNFKINYDAATADYLINSSMGALVGSGAGAAGSTAAFFIGKHLVRKGILLAIPGGQPFVLAGTAIGAASGIVTAIFCTRYELKISKIEYTFDGKPKKHDYITLDLDKK